MKNSNRDFRSFIQSLSSTRNEIPSFFTNFLYDCFFDSLLSGSQKWGSKMKKKLSSMRGRTISFTWRKEHFQHMSHFRYELFEDGGKWDLHLWILTRKNKKKVFMFIKWDVGLEAGKGNKICLFFSFFFSDCFLWVVLRLWVKVRMRWEESFNPPSYRVQREIREKSSSKGFSHETFVSIVRCWKVIQSPFPHKIAIDINKLNPILPLTYSSEKAY